MEKTDDTEANNHAIKDGDGLLVFPKGSYRITRPLEIALTKTGSYEIAGSLGTATIVMAGCTFTNGLPHGINAKDCHKVLITGGTLAETREKPLEKAGINFAGKGSGNSITS